MKAEYIKKITEFATEHVRCYYIQIGTKVVALSMPIELSKEEIKVVLGEFVAGMDNAEQGESLHQASYRAVVNKIEAERTAPIVFLDEE